MITVKCPICHCEIYIDDQVHILDNEERTDYCDICDNIITIQNRRVVKPTVNELLGILGE